MLFALILWPNFCRATAFLPGDGEYRSVWSGAESLQPALLHRRHFLQYGHLPISQSHRSAHLRARNAARGLRGGPGEVLTRSRGLRAADERSLIWTTSACLYRRWHCTYETVPHAGP